MKSDPDRPMRKAVALRLYNVRTVWIALRGPHGEEALMALVVRGMSMALDGNVTGLNTSHVVEVPGCAAVSIAGRSFRSFDSSPYGEYWEHSTGAYGRMR
jgi:hypothetical protein